ncbi:glycoside hydrolase family 16 protein [Halocatena salina]|uniref:Glycoside hydrolase family 16 protein n=1 Tax=Halocatena salina TaxID=2934340 RepID=A0A8U0A218_9EURY|nr:glycoside hydrolase family 16 protein [Halocatena salina]UPM43190.1 glycoside hydrolase family 16 protein [Halocatena salina]
MTDDSSRGSRDAPTNNRLRRRHFLQTAGVTLGGIWAASTASAAVDSKQVHTQAFDGNEWTLSWREEFDTGSIDQGVWNFETGNNDGWGNNELQYYQRENAWIENDQLVIEAREQGVDGYEYTSARMTTAGKYEKQYGRVDVRARLPQGQGIWPAIWMLGADIGSVGWPNCGEIDIMELIGSDVDTVHGTIHGPSYSGGNSIGGSYTNGSFADAYHVFQLTWYPDAIKFFVDGQHYFTVTLYDVQDSGYEWVFDNGSFFLILNVAVGGDWPGYPDASTSFPQRMEVDYIRVYDWV